MKKVSCYIYIFLFVIDTYPTWVNKVLSSFKGPPIVLLWGERGMFIEAYIEPSLLYFLMGVVSQIKMNNIFQMNWKVFLQGVSRKETKEKI